MRAADPHFDLVRIEPERVRHGVGDHGAAAGADVLDRGARNQAPAFHRQFDFRSGLPKIEPVASSDAHAAPVAASLRWGPVAPDFQTGGPVVETLAVWVGVPAFAQ